MQASKGLFQAQEAARQLAQQRLRAGAKALAEVLPPEGVMLSARLRRQRGDVLALLCWPGTLLEREAGGGGIVRTLAADMFHLRPDAAAALVSKAAGRPLHRAACTGPNGERLRATVDAACVVRVRGARSGVLLAMSEPGQPDVLAAAFEPLPPQDLAPRLT